MSVIAPTAGMSANDDQPDPVAYARGLSTEELLAYGATFGESSREWIIAKRELDHRAAAEADYPLGLIIRIALIRGAIAIVVYLSWR